VPDNLDSLLAEQVTYYRARAHEYDATDGVDDESRAQLLDALAAFAPRGRILELACGTGQWTAELARHASSLTAVDASPEMIALNRARVAQENVRYVEADLFAWSATRALRCRFLFRVAIARATTALCGLLGAHRRLFGRKRSSVLHR
jgi:SAM-dependent methyltransferase